jgi:hypothetical protein
MRVSVFKKEEVVQKKTVLEIIKESLDIGDDKIVRFRSRTGRGSGKAVEIPAAQFEDFIKLMLETNKHLVADNTPEVVTETKEN